MKIHIDSDPSLGYEKNSVYKKIFNLFFVPFLNILPRSFQKVIRKSNKAADAVIKEATNHAALEVLYQGGNTHPPKNNIQKLFQYVWFNLTNSKAVRNRLRLVKRELKNELLRRSNQEHVRLLSIAAGSARAVIEAIEETVTPGSIIDATFLDKNPKATQYSKDMASTIPSIRGSWVNETVGTFFGRSHSHFDIVEMVGLLDYFDDDKVVEVCTKIYEHLSPEGMLIVANVHHNEERPFLENVIDWHMIYRTPEGFAALIEKAGFSDYTVYMEPLGIHIVIVARK